MQNQYFFIWHREDPNTRPDPMWTGMPIVGYYADSLQEAAIEFLTERAQYDEPLSDGTVIAVIAVYADGRMPERGWVRTQPIKPRHFLYGIVGSERIDPSSTWGLPIGQSDVESIVDSPNSTP